MPRVFLVMRGNVVCRWFTDQEEATKWARSPDRKPGNWAVSEVLETIHIAKRLAPLPPPRRDPMEQVLLEQETWDKDYMIVRMKDVAGMTFREIASRGIANGNYRYWRYKRRHRQFRGLSPLERYLKRAGTKEEMEKVAAYLADNELQVT